MLELSSQGYSERDIGSKLQISHITVHRDLVHLKRQAQENLQHHIHEVVPMEYERCMVGMKHNLKQTLEIADTTSDPRVKLQARAIANDCYKYIMDLSTSSSVISEAIEFVNRKQGQIDSLQKHNDRIQSQSQPIEEGNNTTNGVF